MSKVVLLIGGNLGNRYDNIIKTCDLIESNIGDIIKKSKIYETEAWGFESEKSFLNQVLIVNSNYTPQQCLNKINKIEEQLGRVRGSEKWISRTMDIDILFYNNEVINTDDLTIPHKHISERLFTLKPLNDLLPDYIHPVNKNTVSELLNRCVDKSKVKVYKTND